MQERDAMRAEIRLEHQKDYRFRTQFESGAPDLTTDAPPPLGDSDGPDSVALLAAAVGNELASSLLHLSRFELRGLQGEVFVERTLDSDGRPRIGGLRVRLVPTLITGESPRFRRCLELFESFCPVTESVRVAIPVVVMVEPVYADGGCSCRVAPPRAMGVEPSRRGGAVLETRT